MKAWPVIGREVTEAILNFFKTNQMCKAINCTLVTLIPKVPNPSTVKQFKPISCCTVIYKIIAKIMTKRLQNVMNLLIYKSQFTFVPGRVIIDNILLSHELVKGYRRKGISPRCMIKVDM